MDSTTDAKPAPDDGGRLDLGENGGIHTLTTVEEIERWLQSEGQAWQWLAEKDRTPAGQAARAVEQRRAEVFKQMGGDLQAAKDARGSVKTALSTIRRAYHEGRILHSRSVRWHEVERLRTQNKGAAIGALLQFMRVPVDVRTFPGVEGDADVLRGRFVACLFDLGLTDDNSARVQAIDGMLAELGADSKTRLDEVDRLRRELEHVSRNAGEQVVEQQNAHRAVVAEHEKRLAGWLDKAKSEFDALQKTYREDIKLKYAVEYWEDRQRSHSTAFIWWGVSFLVIAVVAAAAVLTYAPAYLHPEPAGVPPPSSPGFLDRLPLQRIGPAVLAVTLAIWVLRLLARNVLSNLHLANDAAERVVMAKTYMAMIENSAIQKEGDRELILRALFRPSVKGVVKEDASPPFPWEAVIRKGDGS